MSLFVALSGDEESLLFKGEILTCTCARCKCRYAQDDMTRDKQNG